MKIELKEGLCVALVDTSEAISLDWTVDPPDVDVVRVLNPSVDSWLDLRDAGFTVKPSWVNWRAELHASEAEYLKRLSGSERRNIRLGMRFADERGIVIRVEEGLDPEALDKFLILYDAQIAGMRNGVGYARRQETQLIERRGEYLSVYAYQGDKMVGGCLCLLRHDTSVLQLRFAAAAQTERQGRLQRAVYMKAFQAARDRGLRFMSLGNDPSLYGHITSPGLFRFKARLGFTPIPSHHVDPAVGWTEADRVLSLQKLSDPSLMLAYPIAAQGESTTLQMILFTSSAEVDAEEYRAGFLTGIETRTILPI